MQPLLPEQWEVLRGGGPRMNSQGEIPTEFELWPCFCSPQEGGSSISGAQRGAEGSSVAVAWAVHGQPRAAPPAPPGGKGRCTREKLHLCTSLACYTAADGNFGDNNLPAPQGKALPPGTAGRAQHWEHPRVEAYLELPSDCGKNDPPPICAAHPGCGTLLGVWAGDTQPVPSTDSPQPPQGVLGPCEELARHWDMLQRMGCSCRDALPQEIRSSGQSCVAEIVIPLCCGQGHQGLHWVSARTVSGSQVFIITMD